MRIDPLPLAQSKGYQWCKFELLACREITNLVKEKQGKSIDLTLRERTSESNIQEKVCEQLTLAVLKAEKGLENFGDYRRQSEFINECILKLAHNYTNINKKDMVLPVTILALKC